MFKLFVEAEIKPTVIDLIRIIYFSMNTLHNKYSFEYFQCVQNQKWITSSLKWRVINNNDNCENAFSVNVAATLVYLCFMNKFLV